MCRLLRIYVHADHARFMFLCCLTHKVILAMFKNLPVLMPWLDQSTFLVHLIVLPSSVTHSMPPSAPAPPLVCCSNPVIP